MDKFMVPTKLGLKLAAIFTKPKKVKEKYPLVILLHGNTGWKDEGHISSLADELAKAGIASVRFDAPATNESEGVWEYDYRLSKYLACVPDVLDYCLENFPVDQNRIGVWGHSMGGIVAAYFSAQNPSVVKVFCGSEPSSGDMKSHGASVRWQKEGGIEIETEIFGTVWLSKEFFLDRAPYNTVEAVRNLQIPQLYIGGAIDDIVTPESVRVIYDAANEPKQYLEFGTDHMYKNDSVNLRKINEATVSFFVDNL